MRNLITTICFLLLTAFLVAAQGYDSTKIATTTEPVETGTITIDQYEGTDDFSPGIAFISLIGIGFLLVCVGAGIVITVIGLLMIFGLISMGILSTSILIGLNKKSLAVGFKTFILSTSTIGGLVLFGFGFWAINLISHWSPAENAIIIGITFGLLTGLIFGLVIFNVLQRLTTYLQSRLKLTEG